MVKTIFSTSWKRSTQSRKQRKYRYNAPLHLRQKMLHVHLSPELREKYGFRNVQVRKGDKVKITRGQHRKREGKVERVVLKQEHVFVTGIETIKKDGSKVAFPLSPANLMITDLNLSDRKRKQKITSKSITTKSPSAGKESKKQETGQEEVK